MLQSKCFHSLFASEERGQSELILFPPNIVCLTSELMIFRAEKGNPAKYIFLFMIEEEEPTIFDFESHCFESCSKVVTVCAYIQKAKKFAESAPQYKIFCGKSA